MLGMQFMDGKKKEDELTCFALITIVPLRRIADESLSLSLSSTLLVPLFPVWRRQKNDATREERILPHS